MRAKAKRTNAGAARRVTSMALAACLAFGLNVGLGPLAASARTSGGLREHAPIAAVSPASAANVISSEWIELCLPSEDGFNQSAVMNPENYVVTSVFDGDFRAPVTPKAVNYRWASEEAPYNPTYTNLDWGQKDLMTFETTYRICLQMPDGLSLKEGGVYNVAVSPDVGVGTSYTASFDMSRKNAAFHVNQESYLEEGAKVAYLSWWTGDTADAPGKGHGSVNFDAYKNFYLIDEAAGQSVFEGDVVLAVRGVTDRWGKADNYTLDFTSYTVPGSYHLYIPGVGVSYSFKIGDQSFRDSIGYTVFRGMLMQRDGAAGSNGTKGDGPVPNLGVNFTPLAPSLTGLANPDITHWNRPDAHLDDAIDQNSGVRVDLTGGHMDAGDRGKYPYNSATVSASMLAGALLFPNQVKGFGDDLNLPESGDGIPDYLNEIVYEMDFLYKAVMNTSKDGALPEYLRPSNGGYEMLDPLTGQTGRVFFNKRENDGSGEQEHGVLRSQTLYAAGALAMAYNTPIMREYFPQRCADYLTAAKKAFNAFDAHNNDPSFWRAGSGSDNVSDDLVGNGVKHIWSDELLIAAAQLLQATGDSKYSDWINAEWPTIPLANVKHWGFALDPSWLNAFLALYSCDDPKLDPAKKAEASANIVSWADSMYAGRWDMSFGVPVWDEYAGIYVGWHFTGSDVGYPLMLAYGVTGDKKYLDTLENTWNYLIGTNPTSRSFISNLGDPVTRPHWLVHEISYGQVQQYIKSGGTQGWADVAPGLPAADLQNFRFKSQWGAAFATQWNRDKEKLGFYPEANKSGSNLSVDYVNYAAMWLYQDAWNVDNEFVISNVAREAAGLLPLLGTYADGARDSSLSLSRNGEYAFEAAENYQSAAPVSVDVRNNGFADLTSLSASLADGSDFEITQNTAGTLAKDAATSFRVAPKAGLGIGEYRDTVLVAGNGPDGPVTKTLGVVFRVYANVTSAELYNGLTNISGGSYAFPARGAGYSVADTLTVTVANTGTGALTGLSASAGGADAGAFVVTQPDAEIPAGGSGAFTVTPAIDLGVGTYRAAVTVTADGVELGFDVSFEVTASAPAIGVSANGTDIGDGGSFALKSVGFNYTPAAETVTVTNTGTGRITGLAVSSGGADFVVSQPASSVLEDRESTTFTVKPATALAVGRYTGAIFVTDAEGADVSFDVTINIYPYKIDAVGSPVAYDVTMTDDGTVGVHMVPGQGSLYPWAGNQDEFVYVYQDALDGDQVITARITDWALQGNNGEAGIMLRPNLGGQVPYYALLIKGGAWDPVNAPVNQVVVQTRATAGQGATYPYYPQGNNPVTPRWLKLVVSGATVTAYISADGASWTQADTRALPFAPSSYTAGLAVCGQFYGGPLNSDATFTNVSLGSPTVPNSYNLTVAQSEYGTVTADRQSPVREGLTVTLTATPDSGCYLASLNARYGSGTGAPVTLTKLSDTEYSFVMPAGDVTVTAVFYENGYVDPDALKSIDIGTCSYGRTDVESAVTVTSSSNSGLGMAPDDLRFVYRDNLTGDMTLVANVRVLDQALMDGYTGALPGEAFAGLMVRQTAEDVPGATNYISDWFGIFLVNGSLHVQYAPKGGRYRTDVADVGGIGRIQWLKLVKSGDDYSAYYSADGVNWAQAGTTRTLAGFITEPYAMGLAVGSSKQWNGYDGCVSAVFANIDWITGTVAPTFYNVTVDGNISGGAVLANKTTVQAGEQVTLTAYPDPGYVLDSFSVTAGSAPVTVNRAGDSGSFFMPEGDVTVSAVFSLYVGPSYPFKIKDLGDCAAEFVFTEANGAYSLKSTSRGSMTYGADNCTYGYKDGLTGDQTLIARVDDLAQNSGDSKAGIMFRQDDKGYNESGAYSIWYGIFLSGGNTVWGAAKGGVNASYFGNSPAVSAQKPVWLKIVKAGNVLSSYYSFDAQAASASAVTGWVTADSRTFVFAEPFTMGLFVNGFAYQTTYYPATGTFSRVSWGGEAPATSPLASYKPVVLTQTGDAANENVQYQSAAEVIAALPAAINVTLADGTAVMVPVSWENTGAPYDAALAGDYTFAASWGEMPEGADNSGDLAAPICTVTVAQGAADKSALEELLARAKAVDQALCTPETAAALAAAIAAGESVMANGMATASGVSAAAAALQNALNGLVKAEFVCAVKSMAAKIGKPLQIPFTWNGGGSLSFTSSNPAVCGVSQTGALTPLKAGVAVVTITAPDGTKAVFAVTVTA